MMQSTIILLVAAIFISCNKTVGPSVVNDTIIQYKLIDSEGVNIMTNVDSGYDIDKAKIYYINQDLMYIQHYDARVNEPDFIGLNSDGKISLGAVFGEMDGTYVIGGKSTFYVDYGNYDIDTIEVSGKNTNSIKQIHDIWYNGIHVDSLETCCNFIYKK